MYLFTIRINAVHWEQQTNSKYIIVNLVFTLNHKYFAAKPAGLQTQILVVGLAVSDTPQLGVSKFMFMLQFFTFYEY